MEVPGIAPGSVHASSLASTCVFEDYILPAARLLGGPHPASHLGLSPLSPGAAATPAPDQPESMTPYRLASGEQDGGRVTC